MTELEFWVDGMTCAHCERAVGSELGALSGVIDVSVDAGSGNVRLTHEKPLEHAALASAVEAAGYAVRSWSAPADA